MRLRITHIYQDQDTLDGWVKSFIGAALRECETPRAQLASRLRWKADLVDELLNATALETLDGPDAVSMTIADFEGKSLARARHAVENSLVRSLVQRMGGENCNRLISRMLGVGEWRIRRIRIRAGIAPTPAITAAQRNKLAVPKIQ
jgi:hypothetical protein